MGLQDIYLPATAREWAGQLTDTAGVNNPASVEIKDVQGSASTVTYKDWLLFKALWVVNRTELTHETLFGSEDGRRRAEASENRLAKASDWWGALGTDTKAWGWGTMAAWKQSAEEIKARKNKAMELVVSSHAILDDAASSRVIFAPKPPEHPVSSRIRPRREDPDRAGKYHVPGSNSGESSQGLASRAPSHSPEGDRSRSASGGSSRSQAVRATSHSPEGSLSVSSTHSRHFDSQEEQGSLKGRRSSNGSSSAGSDGFTSRLINKHRPDEALINMSLLLLLQGLSMVLHRSGRASEEYNWSILHKSLAISQPEQTAPGAPAKRQEILAAKTDGCLQFTTSSKDPDDNIVLSIVEVKPYRRLHSRTQFNAIRIQESTEMAAWISTESTKGILLSDDSGVYRYGSHPPTQIQSAKTMTLA